jgi:hypothetical protein
MQKAGIAFPVRPAGHFGRGACGAALALAAAVADEEAARPLAEGCAGGLLAAGAEADAEAAVPFASSLSQAMSAQKRSVQVVANRMRARIHAFHFQLERRSSTTPSGRPRRAGRSSSSTPSRIRLIGFKQATRLLFLP